MLFVVLLFVGGAPTQTGANDPVSSNAVAPNRARLSPPPAAPAPATPVPHSAPYFKIVPAGQLGKLDTSGSKQPFFRGGTRSRAGASSSATVSPRVATASPRTVLYNGLNKPGENAGLSGNLGGTPPDSTGAIGPSNYVEMVNSSIAVYDRSLNLLTRATFDNFVGQPSGVPLCDPQIEWDPAANRWLYAMLYCNLSNSVQRLLVGWSKTSDPSTLSSAGWCQFAAQTDPYLVDFPKLGHNSHYLIVGGNLYNETNPSTNPPFVSAAIVWVPLPASNTDTNCGTPSLGATPLGLKNGDNTTLAFTPVPVNTDSSATDGYVVSAYDAGGNVTALPTPQSRLAVWHLDAAGVLHQDADIPVTTYVMPFSAPQLNGTINLLDTLDGRLTQAVGDPVTGIWTQHTVNGAGNRSVVTWYKITASGSATTLADVGTISDPNDWVFNAAISPRFDAQGAAIEYNRSSLTTYPVIAAQIRIASTPAGQMEPGELVLATSSNFDADFTCNNPSPGVPCRWGDYSAASPDPVQTNVVWGTNEFNTASGSTPAWSDENFALLVGTIRTAAQVPAPPAPSRDPVNPAPAPSPPAR